ncbi:hypothetical protein E0Z10_g9189 [Xylaria hypoxylon]|uniref:EamA domain-containing protein n=1 Tax=Xylaria hypoxylon TaxID=37992 RepID=A0A4Z0YL46_9PEZI|nr:hypothetical protein E0Z10_g9189 [Xylaria hypoxylon]
MASSEPLAVAGDIAQGGDDRTGNRPSVTLSVRDHPSSSLRSRGSSINAGRTFGVWHLARRTLGISLLLVTVFLWTTSNFLASAWRGRPHGTGRFKAQAGNEDSALGERLLVDGEECLETHSISRSAGQLSFLETAKFSLEFAMIWFLGNYFASACLEYTSIGSVTILTSTSSVWTLIFCAIMRIEPFSVRKLIGVLASLSGVILISFVDLSGDGNDDGRGNFPHKTQAQIAIGDAMAFFSAIIYGVYVVVMKVRIGSEDRVNMPLFFGLVGTFNILLLWPLFPILHYTGIEPFELPPSGKIWTIILVNSLASFISDISWAYAMLLTTPLVVTVGLSLNIPLSLIGEMIQYEQYSSFVYWVGAVIVVISFLFVNHESHENDGHNKEAGSESEL